MSNGPQDDGTKNNVVDLMINDKRGTNKKEAVREEAIPTYPMIVEMLLKGHCTNAQARNWVQLHLQAQATQEAMMSEPNYMAMVRASEEVYNRCQPLAEEIAANFSSGEATIEDWRRQISYAIDEKLKLFHDGGEMRPLLVDITALGMVALVELDMQTQPRSH